VGANRAVSPGAWHAAQCPWSVAALARSPGSTRTHFNEICVGLLTVGSKGRAWSATPSASRRFPRSSRQRNRFLSV